MKTILFTIALLGATTAQAMWCDYFFNNFKRVRNVEIVQVPEGETVNMTKVLETVSVSKEKMSDHFTEYQFKGITFNAKFDFKTGQHMGTRWFDEYVKVLSSDGSRVLHKVRIKDRIKHIETVDSETLMIVTEGVYGYKRYGSTDHSIDGVRATVIIVTPNGSKTHEIRFKAPNEWSYGAPLNRPDALISVSKQYDKTYAFKTNQSDEAFVLIFK